MNRFLCLFGVFFIFAASIPINAQDQQQASTGRIAPGLRRQALVLNIDARVLEEGGGVIWNENNRKVAIPGSPVGIKMVGSNVVVVVQFTPFIRRQGNVLVAQGQIWIEDPQRGISYYTSIQTIPMEFNEPIYFFPLGGESPQFTSTIEIILTVIPYNETIADQEESAGNDR